MNTMGAIALAACPQLTHSPQPPWPRLGYPPCPVPADFSSAVSSYKLMKRFGRPANRQDTATRAPPRQRSEGQIPLTPLPVVRGEEDQWLISGYQ